MNPIFWNNTAISCAFWYFSYTVKFHYLHVSTPFLYRKKCWMHWEYPSLENILYTYCQTEEIWNYYNNITPSGDNRNKIEAVMMMRWQTSGQSQSCDVILVGLVVVPRWWRTLSVFYSLKPYIVHVHYVCVEGEIGVVWSCADFDMTRCTYPTATTHTCRMMLLLVWECVLVIMSEYIL